MVFDEGREGFEGLVLGLGMGAASGQMNTGWDGSGRGRMGVGRCGDWERD